MPAKAKSAAPRKTSNRKPAESDLQRLENSLAEHMRVTAEQLAEQNRVINALHATVQAQRNSLQALQAELNRDNKTVSSFIGRDLLWIARAIALRGPRTGLLQARDYFVVRKSGQFDPAFYASQLGNSTFSDATLLRHYIAEGYRRGLDPSPTFSVDKYLSIYPDVYDARTDPFSHYLRFGRREYRIAPPSARARLTQGKGLTQGKSAGTAPKTRRARLIDYFLQPAEGIEQFDTFTFTNLMAYVWASRLDLRMGLDINDYNARFNFGLWFVMEARNEYNLPAEVFPEDLLYSLRGQGGKVLEVVNGLLKKRGALSETVAASATTDTAGANLVGYAYGEFGMGEHVRQVARSLNTTTTHSVIINQKARGHGSGDLSAQDWVAEAPRHTVNIFHINADIFPFLYFELGEAFFNDRYNIGYWAWELAEVPREYDISLNMVDEVWAISDFVAEAFRKRARVPVTTMPLAVTVPELDPAHYTKTYFGLPEDNFTFLFIFDAHSHLDRKNPMAAVRAFRAAFPTGREKVRLLFKAMNVRADNRLWGELMSEIGEDPRITTMQTRLAREELMGLYLACNAFVSLHRAEGFGRCVAEAMAYGKPVIATNYSGTVDFAHEGTACMVDYTLVDVPEGAYPLGDHQVWADPDVGQAAAHMRRLHEDDAFRTTIARAGQVYILTHFSAEVMGKRYAARLAEIEVLRAEKAVGNAVSAPITATSLDIFGNMDGPGEAEAAAIADTLAIQGWVVARSGIEKLDMFIDDEAASAPHYGTLRPDVAAAHPDLPDCGRSGFFFQMDISGLSKGRHTARMVATARDGGQREWRLDFTCVGSVRYDLWQKITTPLALKQAAAHKRKAKRRISVAVVARAGDADGLKATLDALAAQTYPASDIFVVSPDDSWPQIAKKARGDALTVLDSGDVATPWALGALAAAFEAADRPDFVYGDEDVISDGQRIRPRFKPGWSPLFLDQSNYIGKPWCVEKAVLQQALTAKPQSEHDLLRAIGKTAKAVAHVPNILCSRPLALPAAIAPIDILPPKPGSARVSIIIPTCLGHLDIVERCFKGLSALTAYPDIEVILVTNNLADPAAAKTFLDRWPFKVVHWQEAGFNWSALNNFGTRHATGDYLLYLNDDIESIRPDWLDRLVATLDDSGAGIIGPMLRYPNRTMQHLGINLVPYGGGARHLFRFCSGSEDNLRWIMDYPREVSAVTGACLLTTRALYEALDGFDETIPVVCNDVDFCLRAQAKGEAVVIEPRAELIHHEGISRGGISESEDVKRFWSRWAAMLKRPDPYASPNLDIMRDDWMVDAEIVKLPPLRCVKP